MTVTLQTLRDNMAEILSRILRIPVAGKPITIFDISAVPSEIVEVVVSLLCRLVFDFALWSEAISLLSRGSLTDAEFHQVLALRERMNRGGKRGGPKPPEERGRSSRRRSTVGSTTDGTPRSSGA